MNSPIPQIAEELKRHLAPLDEEENRLRSELAALKDERRRLEAALTALGGGPTRARPPKRTKPCVTKREVTEAIQSLVQSHRSISLADLESLTKERLSEEGKRSLSGFSLQFREAIKAPEFLIDDEGSVSLASNAEIHAD